MPRKRLKTTPPAVAVPAMIVQPTEQALLQTRLQASQLLNCSIASLIRLEKQGRLTAIKLNKQSPSAAMYYSRADLLALASGR